jgi:membrane protein
MAALAAGRRDNESSGFKHQSLPWLRVMISGSRLFRRTQTVLEAIYRLYEHSGFSMAGAVAFSFVVSLFPFCIFLGALGSILGNPEIAKEAVAQLFQILPPRVAEGLAPEVANIMGRSRIDLLGLSGLITLFFATSAIETLRAALNGAYRVKETRAYPLCLLLSMVFVLVSAVSMLVLTWTVVVGPGVAAKFEPSFVKNLLDSSWLAIGTRYALAGAVIAAQLFAFHIWLAAGRRSISDVWPGVALSMVLWLASAGLYSRYLDFNDYSRFYAGLSQLMVAMIYFQVTAIIVILGAELNRGLLELKRLRHGNPVPVAA